MLVADIVCAATSTIDGLDEHDLELMEGFAGIKSCRPLSHRKEA